MSFILLFVLNNDNDKNDEYHRPQGYHQVYDYLSNMYD